MESGALNPNSAKPKVVVVMGATGSGKSRLAIDLASLFPSEIINADSMQVYQGLDILTNKVPIQDRKGVPHHLLGTVGTNVDFTSKDFRDSAIPIVDDIWSRNYLPIIVGGTNYYIQALVGPFLLDESIEDLDDCGPDDSLADQLIDFTFGELHDELHAAYDSLKKLDPVAANRIHPNNHRKVSQYLRLYATHGVIPSKLFQGKASEKWGRPDNLRYDCCFIWVDASLPVLDRYVEQRIDSMVDAGLLEEVYDIYNPNADYTRGLQQAIGVREFEPFLKCYLSKREPRCYLYLENGFESDSEAGLLMPKDEIDEILKTQLRSILNSDETNLKILLSEAIEKMKANTCRLVRRQKRRLNRLRTFFGWKLHYVDATEAFLCESGDDTWTEQVVVPCATIIKAFLQEDSSSTKGSENINITQMSAPRDLWTQHVCEACGNRVLRGDHEWEQHKQGRGHRKRVISLRKKIT